MKGERRNEKMPAQAGFKGSPAQNAVVGLIIVAGVLAPVALAYLVYRGEKGK